MRNLLAVKFDLSSVRRNEPRDDMKEGALPGAARAEQYHDLVSLTVQADIGQDRSPCKALFDPPDV
jgi:hypothetical protein